MVIGVVMRTIFPHYHRPIYTVVVLEFDFQEIKTKRKCFNSSQLPFETQVVRLIQQFVLCVCVCVCVSWRIEKIFE